MPTIEEHWVKLHGRYERRMYKVLQKGFRGIAQRIPFANMTAENYRLLIPLNVHGKDVETLMQKSWLAVLNPHFRLMKRQFAQIKAAEDEGEIIRRLLLELLGIDGGQKIKIVAETLIAHIVTEIEKGIAANKDIRTIAREIESTVNSPKFYRWQAMRIARTETTIVANKAAEAAANESRLVLEKAWVCFHDGRERASHLSAASAGRIDANEPFNVAGFRMMYPGDGSDAPAEEVINCRCTVAYFPKRNADGLPIRR